MPTPSLESRVRHLEDVEELRLLMARYHEQCDGWDEAGSHKDPAGIARLFSDSGVWAVGPAPFTGPTEIATRAVELQGSIPWIVHFFVNPIVAVDGDKASADFKAVVRVKRGGRPDPGWTLGTYHMDAARTPDGWRIQSLTFQRIYNQD